MQHVVGHLEGVGEGRPLVGDAEQVLVRDDDQRVDELLQLVDAGLGDAHAVAPSKWKGLVTTPTVRMPYSRATRAITGRRAGAGAAAHAGGDEHHVRAAHRFEDLVERLLGRGAADIGARPGAEPAGDADAELDLARRARLLQRLGVGVADDELAADQVRPDHVVDGVSAGAADADDGDARLHLVLVLRDAQIDHAVVLHCRAS